MQKTLVNPVAWHFGQLQTHYAGDKMRFFAASVLGGVLVSTALVMAVFTVLTLAMDAEILDTRTKAVFVPFEALMVMFMVLAYTALMRGAYGFARGAFTTLATGATFLGVFITGGFPHSVAVPCLISIPVIAYCLHGRKLGLRAAIIVPVVAIGQWVFISTTGLSLPDFTSKAAPSVNVSLVMFVIYGIVVFIVACYDLNARALRSKLDDERNKLAELANQDGLTGLSNARSFHEIFDGRIREAKTVKAVLTVFYFDLDGFKPINDNHGHDAGDAILQEVAHRLESGTKDEDIVARLGGDEFAILLKPNTSEREALESKERLRMLVCEPIEFNGTTHRVGTSIGMASYPDDGMCRVELIKAADRSMYTEKLGKGDRRKRQQTRLPTAA